MRIAVASAGKEKDSDISGNAGRAPYYLIFDGKGKIMETLKNPFAIGGGGAGFGVAKMLADRDVDLVISGSFGPNMTGALKDRGIGYREMKGKAPEAASKAGQRS